jgi:hypothetical protein
MPGLRPLTFRAIRLGGFVGAASVGAAAAILAGGFLVPSDPRAATSPIAAASALAGAATASGRCEGDDTQCDIERAVRRFIATAVERNDVAASFSLVTPELRRGLSEREWATGDIPVIPFAAVDWQAFRLLFSDITGSVSYYRVHLRSEQPSYGEADFWIGLEHRGGRWLISYFAPAAIFGAPSGG